MLDYLRFKEINELFMSGQIEAGRRLLMEMQSRYLALRDEMQMIKIRLQNTEAALHIARNLIIDNNFYWLNSDGIRQGPYCPRCFEQEGGLIHLEKIGDKRACPCCGEIFTNKSKTEPAKHAKILQFSRP